jgi:hypothetical protein
VINLLFINQNCHVIVFRVKQHSGHFLDQNRFSSTSLPNDRNSISRIKLQSMSGNCDEFRLSSASLTCCKCCLKSMKTSGTVAPKILASVSKQKSMACILSFSGIDTFFLHTGDLSFKRVIVMSNLILVIGIELEYCLTYFSDSGK